MLREGGPPRAERGKKQAVSFTRILFLLVTSRTLLIAFLKCLDTQSYIETCDLCLFCFPSSGTLKSLKHSKLTRFLRYRRFNSFNSSAIQPPIEPSLALIPPQHSFITLLEPFIMKIFILIFSIAMTGVIAVNSFNSSAIKPPIDLVVTTSISRKLLSRRPTGCQIQLLRRSMKHCQLRARRSQRPLFRPNLSSRRSLIQVSTMLQILFK